MRILCAIAVLAVLLGNASAVGAQTTVTLAWDANTEPDIAGYEVSYGTQSGVYTTIVDVGNVTSVPFGLPSSDVYYFAVKAYNSASPRQYSPYSIEVSTAGTAPGTVKTTPVITWANPASITYGTALSATQLNATANVAGTFAYTPAAGTVLPVGTQTLSVIFTPTDTTNYTTASKTVTINVLKVSTKTTSSTSKGLAKGKTPSTTGTSATTTTTVTLAARTDGTTTVAATSTSTPSSGTALEAGTDSASYSAATATTSPDVPRQKDAVNQAPIGAFDTPADGATGLQGSFAVTGWALDDVGVDRVELWRDLVAGEDPAHAYTIDPSHPAYGKVFIASPLFVTNSRTDVEGLYSTYPFANRAGWGYVLQSWGLPNQGNGVYTLYAFAFDADGHSAPLGTKTITVDNAQATKPFGAIDAPAYGETKSGIFDNVGWALTPVGPSSCRIENGGVMVSIDSGPLMRASYGDAREDIAAAFPDLLNSTNASGAFAVDTTKLSNGVHQIGWLVADSCGRQDGIGSRFFTVLNSAAPPAGDSTGPRPETSRKHALTYGVAIRQMGGDWQDVQLDAEGRYAVDVAQGGRIEVRLPRADGAYAGFHEVQEQRRLLPLGSSLGRQAGVFYWQPDAAFLGTFDLVFEAADSEAVRLRVVVK